MELSYTLMNLGALELQRVLPDASESLQLNQLSVKYNQMALVLDPGNREYRTNMGTNLAWLADAWMGKCGLGDALKHRNRAVDLRRELQLEYPRDTQQTLELAYALNGLAGCAAGSGFLFSYKGDVLANMYLSLRVIGSEYLWA